MCTSCPDEILELIRGTKGNTVSDEQRNKAFKILRTQGDNKVCFDCSGRNPTWLSLSLGVYLCLDCSGEHRAMGVHLSFVRSATLDSFTPIQLIQVTIGGNTRAKEFFHRLGITEKRKGGTGSGLRLDYKSDAAERYRTMLSSEAKRIAAENDLGPDSSKNTDRAMSSSPVRTSLKETSEKRRSLDASENLKSKTPEIPQPVKVAHDLNPAFGAAARKAPVAKIQAKRISDFDFDQFE